MSTSAFYERAGEKTLLPAGANTTFALEKVRQPFEDVSIWVFSLGGYKMEILLNGIAVSTQNIAAGAAPQDYKIPGIFPPNAPGCKYPPGVIPAVRVTNTDTGSNIYDISILARVYGSAT